MHPNPRGSLLRPYVGLLFFAVCSITYGADVAYDPVADLDLFFGSRCESMNGPLTSQARADAQALNNIFTNIATDPACNGIRNSLTNIAGLSTNDLLQGNLDQQRADDVQKSILRLQAEIRRAASEKGDKNYDPQYILDLQARLRERQLDYIDARQVPNTTRMTLRLQGLDKLYSYVGILAQQIENPMNELCIRNNKSQIAQFLAQAIGVSAAFNPGLQGAEALVAGSIADSIVNLIHKWLKGKGYRLHERGRLMISTSCAVESLAQTYCEAKDSDYLIAFTQSLKSKKTNYPESAKVILDLWGSAFGSYSTWVGRIRAGSTAVSPGDADDKSTAIQSDSFVQRRQQAINGEVAKTTRQLQTISDAQHASDARLALLNRIADFLDNTQVTATGITSSPNPINDAFPKICGPITIVYTNGAKDTCPQNPSEACITCLVRLFPTIPAMDDITGGIAKLFDRAAQTVSQELSLDLEKNPQSVLLEATQKNREGFSAIDFIKKTNYFLVKLFIGQDDFIRSNANLPLAIKDLQQRLDKALEIFNAVQAKPIAMQAPLNHALPLPLQAVNPQLGPDPAPQRDPPTETPIQAARRRVSELRDQLIPEGELFFISTALRSITRQYIDYLYHKKFIDEQIYMQLLLSDTDSLSTLLTKYRNVEIMRSQAREARRLSRLNIESLATEFQDELLTALATSANQKNQGGDAHDTWALTCIRFLALPDSLKKKRFMQSSLDVASLCHGAVYRDVVGKVGVSFDEANSWPEDKRVCALYTFLRKSEFRENR